MLCLPSGGPLRSGASDRRERHQGAGHLPHERAGHGTKFSGRSEAVRLYTGAEWPRPYVEGGLQQLYCACGNLQHHRGNCQACGQRDLQVLLGARNATLGAQVVAESWASPFNDDKKLIAFSDSVQDAAHRAGFFGARTYLNTVGTAMARAIDVLATPAARSALPCPPKWPSASSACPASTHHRSTTRR
jgi:hypothetical protein